MKDLREQKEGTFDDSRCKAYERRTGKRGILRLDPELLLVGVNPHPQTPQPSTPKPNPKPRTQTPKP